MEKENEAERFAPLVTIHPQVRGGTPVFCGTRVPIETFFSYISNDYSLDEFLDCFPTVTKGAAVAVLKEAERILIEQATHLE